MLIRPVGWDCEFMGWVERSETQHATIRTPTGFAALYPSYGLRWQRSLMENGYGLLRSSLFQSCKCMIAGSWDADLHY